MRGGIARGGAPRAVLVATRACYLWAVRRAPLAIALLGTALLALLGVTCLGDPDVPEAPSAVTDLEPTFRGCFEVRPGACVLEPGPAELVVWHRAAPHATVDVTIDGRRVAPVTVATLGGLRHRIAVPSDRERLVIEVEERGVRARWSLRFEAIELPAALVEAKAARDAHDEAEAARKVEPLTQHAAVEVRTAALGIRGRARYWLGDIDGGLADLRRAIREERAAGLSVAQTRDVAALAHFLTSQARYADAVEALALMEPLAATSHEARILGPYHASINAKEYGDVRTAMRLQLVALEEAERLDLGWVAQAVRSLRAGLLVVLGRFGEAETLDAAALLHAADANACTRAAVVHNVGRHALMKSEADGRARPRAVERLREALRLYGRRCPRASSLLNVSTTTARAELMFGRVEAAEALVERVATSTAPMDARDRIELQQVMAELAVARGDEARALSAYERLETIAELGDLTLHRWQALVGKARILRRRQDLEGAVFALERAERLVDRRLLVVPLGEGRDASVRRFEVSARMLVESLLDLGRVDEAARAGLRSRSRALAVLQWANRVSTMSPDLRTRWYTALAHYRRTRRDAETAQADVWRLTNAELRATRRARSALRETSQVAFEEALSLLRYREASTPGFGPVAPGELRLQLHPLVEGWVLVWSTAEHVREVRIAELPPLDDVEALSRAIVAPVADRLASVRRVVVVAQGEAAHIPYAALSNRGVPLGRSHEVVHGTMAAARGRADVLAGKRALVVIDPTQDLASAEREGSAIVAHLERLGWEVRVLRGEEATYERFMAELDGGDIGLLHYAGHAKDEGIDGRGSALALAREGELTAMDVLALRDAPGVVTLSACSAAARRDRVAPGLNLAQAFVAAGASVVIAAATVVDDEQTRRIMSSIYRSPFGGPEDVIASVRNQANAEGEFGAFSIYVP